MKRHFLLFLRQLLRSFYVETDLCDVLPVPTPVARFLMTPREREEDDLRIELREISRDMRIAACLREEYGLPDTADIVQFQASRERSNAIHLRFEEIQRERARDRRIFRVFASCC